MPPSPAMRCSPGREIPGNKHRRGHSIEYGTLFRDKDEEDLALFTDLQDKERDDFLLQSSDDLEDVFSTRLKHFSEFNIPVQGESSRLLTAEGDKNDYDWLLTPPDTPLFPSLDDEPPAASAGRIGRPQSQISLSRSSTMEKRRRSSRGSASPNRLSTSPRADNMQQTRGRPSSARHPSPASGPRSVTPPVRRVSPSPGKPSGPISRSSTPTSRRMSTGSTTTTRGTSPVRTSRGNSASPKIKVWQSNIPGFSLDAPPNLRTSLGDRPASYVRGSSPASRNGRDAAATSTRIRQSVSPSASRSVSSSHSHERDRLSSHSKGSVASSGDADLQSLQSTPVRSSEPAVSKRASLSPNSRTSRSSKLQSPGSAPRRPFESALRQMDHPKSHHSMFRPLASSLPSTGIYSGKSSSSYHHLMLRHSSPTVGSNSSSSQIIGFVPDTKGSDPIPIFQSEVKSLDYPGKHGQINAFGMVDLLHEGSRHESSFSDQLGDMDQSHAVECESSVNEEANQYHVSDVENSSTRGSHHLRKELLEGVGLETMEVCGRCGSHYRVTEATRSEIKICPDCREEHNFVEADPSGTTRAQEIFDEKESSVETIPAVDVLESLPVAVVEAEIVESREDIEQCDDSYEEESSVSRALGEHDVETFSHQDEIQSSTGYDLPNTGTKDTQNQLSEKHHDLKIGSSEVRGVPLLIKRSVSMKSPMIRADNSSGLTRSYEGFSYLRDISISLRSSTETTSASSSWDYGSSIRKGSHVRHQSGSTLDMETHRYDTNYKSLSSMSSSSGVSSHTCKALNVMPADSSEVSASQIICTPDETHQESHPELQVSEYKETSVMNAGFGENDGGSVGLSTEVVGTLAAHNLVITDNEFRENGDGDDVANTVSKIEISESPGHLRSTSELGALPVTDDHTRLEEKDGNESPRHGVSTMTASEIELESCAPETHGLGVHDEIPESECNLNAVDDDCSEKSMGHDSAIDHHNSLAPHVNEILDESTVIVECPGGKETKSLTLEEATDAILFCSSIVHDLVYEAATIAMDNKAKDVPVEEEILHHPTVTVLGKSNANRSSSYGQGGGVKEKKKQSSKARRKQRDTEEKTEVHIENDENASEAAAMISNVGVPPPPSKGGESLKPPPKLENKCNCSIM